MWTICNRSIPVFFSPPTLAQRKSASLMTQPVKKSVEMSEKSIIQEARDIQLAMELITGCSFTNAGKRNSVEPGRLIKLYKELRGSPRMLPFSTDWFYDLGAEHSRLHVL